MSAALDRLTARKARKLIGAGMSPAKLYALASRGSPAAALALLLCRGKAATALERLEVEHWIDLLGNAPTPPTDGGPPWTRS